MNCKNCKFFKRASDVNLPPYRSDSGKETAIFGICGISINITYYATIEDLQKEFKINNNTFGGQFPAVHENFGCINFKPNE